MYDLEHSEKQWKPWKMRKHTIGYGIWLENWNTSKIRNTQCFTWNMERNTQKRGKWEMHIIGPGVCRENCKSWNIRNTKYRTWITGRKLKNLEKEIETVENMYYGEKTEKRGKWDTNIGWHGFWREKWKNMKNEKLTW